MATTIRPASSIDELDLPMRVYNALRRNNVRTVGDLLELTPDEFLRMRNVGEGSPRDLHATLAAYGFEMAAERPAPDPAAMAGAEWLGQQLTALLPDHRVPPSVLRDVPATENRRAAWEFYKWAMGRREWPNWSNTGSQFALRPVPGSVELHLADLNRLAHEELGA